MRLSLLNGRVVVDVRIELYQGITKLRYMDLGEDISISSRYSFYTNVMTS